MRQETIDDIERRLAALIDPLDPQGSIDELMEGYQGDDPEAMRALIGFFVRDQEGEQDDCL